MRITKTYLSDEYSVSDTGIVYGKNGKPLKPNTNCHGYRYVVLMLDDRPKTVMVHRLVAMAFCPGYKDGLQVNHKDGDKTNNNYTNLEWVTRYDNVQHAIHVLGYDQQRSHNSQAKKIMAYSKNGNLIVE